MPAGPWQTHTGFAPGGQRTYGTHEPCRSCLSAARRQGVLPRASRARSILAKPKVGSNTHPQCLPRLAKDRPCQEGTREFAL
jgi:hypothetical protein